MLWYTIGGGEEIMETRGVAMAFACPLPLEEWLVKEAKLRGITKSRLVAEILREVSGLDVELRGQGHPKGG